MPTTDRRHDLLIRNVDPADELTLKHASVDAGTNLTEYLRRVLHEKAESLRPAGPATGHKFEFVITGMTADNATEFWEGLVADTDLAGFQIGGGYVQVDDNGHPVA